MPEANAVLPAVAGHGAAVLPRVTVDAYNAELKDSHGGYIGDRASKGAFADILDQLREKLRKVGSDPFGDTPTEEISRKTLDKVLASDNLEAAGVVQSAIEEFAQEFAGVIKRFLKLKPWRGTDRLVIGGGFKHVRIGELAIARAGVIIKSDGLDLEVQTIRHHPDEAALIGAVQLAPTWIFTGFDGIIGVDIGGTNMRAGLVKLNARSEPDLGKTSVARSVLWRHSDDKPTREQAVKRLVDMIEELVGRADKEKVKLAPFIGIGCPGVIREDGSIEKGGQNLPGNWESSKFNLPHELREAIPKIDGHDTAIVMHNDAVVQGLSETPFMQDVKQWGVMTIGTGLGNACFTNRESNAG